MDIAKGLKDSKRMEKGKAKFRERANSLNVCDVEHMKDEDIAKKIEERNR